MSRRRRLPDDLGYVAQRVAPFLLRGPEHRGLGQRQVRGRAALFLAAPHSVDRLL